MDDLVKLLMERYGLPRNIAENYAIGIKMDRPGGFQPDPATPEFLAKQAVAQANVASHGRPEIQMPPDNARPDPLEGNGQAMFQRRQQAAQAAVANRPVNQAAMGEGTASLFAGAAQGAGPKRGY